MRRMKKAIAIVIATATMASQAMPTFAAEWKQNEIGYWYQEDNGSYPTNSWKWINGRCYYFDSNGYMLANTTTPDGYTVDCYRCLDSKWCSTDTKYRTDIKNCSS